MVRILSIVMAFLLSANAFCGGNKTPQTDRKNTSGVTGAQQLPAEAFQPLTDDEIAGFEKALPGVGDALDSAGYKTTVPGQDDPLPVAFEKVIDPIGKVPGVADALAKAGTNWNQFRATHYKLSAAAAAVGVDMAMATKEQWSKDTSAAARDYARRVEGTRKYCAGVPEGNKQMMQKYGAQLQDMGRLVRM